MTRTTRRGGETWAERHVDDPHSTPQSLGCAGCPDLKVCGGLHVRSGAFDCTSYCCGTPESCDAVCRRNRSFTQRMWEVGGFDLARLSRAPGATFQALPVTVPLVYSRGRRQEAFAPRAVALVLYHLIDGHRGTLKFSDAAAVYRHFAVRPGTPIVLSGTDRDVLLERWWALGTRRAELLRELAALGVVAATTPNFSVFSDVPRWDNLHSMKRIAICWQEMAAAGVPAALHVNARTDHDWKRWTAFVRERSEITTIAYEFATGAAGRRQLARHVGALRNLADAVPRRLSLVVRGALGHLGDLAGSFAQVSMIDSTTYMKTAHRMCGTLDPRGRVHWRPDASRPEVDMDSLMGHNYWTMTRAAEIAISKTIRFTRRAAS